MKGQVEFFNNMKGWGIIKGENQESFFIHHIDIVDVKFFPSGKPTKFRTLSEGQLVEFDVEESTTGRHSAAKNLRIFEDAQVQETTA